MKNPVFTGLILAWVASTGLGFSQGFPGAAGHWTFDDNANPLAATVGADLQLSGTHQLIAGPTASDRAVRIGPGSFYRCLHGMAANGGGTPARVNQYTLVMDVRVAALGLWYSLFQTNSANTDDGDAWINTSGTLGVAATGYSTAALSPNAWHRIVISASNGNFYNYYVDGNLFHTGTVQALGGRFGIEPAPNPVLFFADNDGEDNTLDASQIVIYNRALSASEVTALGGFTPPAATPRYAGRNGWYKGNSHIHTNRVGGGELSPSAAAQWYHDNDYDYIVLTEHRVFLGNPDVTFFPRRSNFLVISGEEFNSLTGYGNNHTTVINASGALGDIAAGATTRWDFFNRVYNLVISRGGYPFMNHPTWASVVTPDDFSRITGYMHFELFNGSVDTDNYAMFGGTAGAPASEVLWDSILTRGLKYYGVGSDDMHQFSPRPDPSNPMTGWTMIKAQSLAIPDILNAYRTGQFYATSGIILEDISANLGLIRVKVDTASTRVELSRRDGQRLVNPARPVASGTPGYRIDFFGPRGRLIRSVTGDSADYQVTNSDAYVRARVTYLRTIQPGQAPYSATWGGNYITANNITREEYYAWGQPYFTDSRREGPALVFGCTDSTYLEYNPNANVLDSTRCINKNSTVVQKGRLSFSGENGMTISIPLELGRYDIEIRALSGKLIQKLESSTERKHSVSGLAAYGTYIVKIRTERKTLVKRIRIR